jgi:hypothetical protein
MHTRECLRNPEAARLSEFNLLLRVPHFAQPGLKAVRALAFAEMLQKYGPLFEPQEKYCCSAD